MRGAAWLVGADATAAAARRALRASTSLPLKKLQQNQKVTAAACKASTTTFALTRVSKPSCAAAELAVFWPRLIVALSSDCSYAVSGPFSAQAGGQGAMGFFGFPTSTARLPYGGGGGNTWMSKRFVGEGQQKNASPKTPHTHTHTHKTKQHNTQKKHKNTKNKATRRRPSR